MSAAPSHSETPVPSSDREPKWRTGTLVYTTGGLVALFVWLLWGDFGYYLKERAMMPAIAILLVRFGASDFLVGLLRGSLPQAMSVLLLPIIGYRSDRYRSRWGRRIPFLALSIPIAVGGMVGLAFSPALGGLLDRLLGAHSPGYNPCVIVSLAFFWLMFEFSTVICNCLFHALIADVVPQNVVGRFYAMFRIISTSAGMAFTYALLGRIKEFYFPIFLALAAVYGVTFSLMCFKVKEGSYPPPPSRDDGPKTLAAVTYLKACFSKPYYLWIFAAVAFGYMSTESISVYIYAYAPSIGLDLGRLGKYQTLQLFLSVLQAYPLGWLCDRFHPLRVCLAALSLMVVANLAAFFLVHDPHSLGIAVVAVGTLSGSWATAYLAMAPTLLPKSQFSTLHSAMTLCWNFGLMIVVPVCGAMLDAMDHAYIHIYYWGALISACSLLATFVVYRRFLALGGPRGYVAP